MAFLILTSLYVALTVAGIGVAAVGAWKNFRVLGLFPNHTAPIARPWVYGGIGLMAAGAALLMFAPQ